MASFILGTRKGASTTFTYPRAGMLQLDYVMSLAAQYLQTKTAESTMANGLSRVEMAGALGDVFGETSNTTIANRIAVHIWPETSVRQAFASAAQAGRNNIKSIHSNVESGGYKSVTVKLSYTEVYNLATGRTVLTVIDSASATSYNK